MRLAISMMTGVLALLLASSPAPAAPKQTGAHEGAAVSAQREGRVRRRSTRITVRPRGELVPGQDYRRVCVPVFEERLIPQWGGRVLYASQSCRWVPVPPGTPPAW